MKNIKLAVIEKQLIRTFFVFFLIQLVIVFMFMLGLYKAVPIDIQETKQIEITVDDVYFYRGLKNNHFGIYSGSEMYSFANFGVLTADRNNFTNRKLYETISVGDRLTIIYYEKPYLIRENWVVDARSDNEIYRTFEGFSRRQEGAVEAVITLFAIIEIAFCGIVLLYIWLDKNIIKGLFEKIKKHFNKRKSNKKINL